MSQATKELETIQTTPMPKELSKEDERVYEQYRGSS